MNCTAVEIVEFHKSRSNKFDTQHDNLQNVTLLPEQMTQSHSFYSIPSMGWLANVQILLPLAPKK